MTKNIKIDKNLENYISDNSYELHPIQREIIEHNNNLGDIKRMQISVTQGYFIQLLIKINNVKKILEIGTFTGYSALSMALAIKEDGLITCLDKNQKTSQEANNFFKKAKVDNKINLIVGSAINSLNDLIIQKNFFDLIFIDADKENYIKYFELAYKLLSSRGLIIVDNVLWKGDVIDKNKNDRMTDIIRDFNTHIKNDRRIEKTILPIGDGVTICRKL
ncbi:class I SAM-dependent methyltransferase [Candidatus Pelagibacter sp.]|nr:class I SAM-dependent methyltransferase [Candidatus Pelagibacter sp.]